MDDEIAGYCPMGCGRTLFRAAGGRVTCSFSECPNLWAVDEILSDRETEHIVEFRADTFIIRHPLRGRLGDELMSCRLHGYIEDLDGPPVDLGRYRARRLPGGEWSWEPIAPALAGENDLAR